MNRRVSDREHQRAVEAERLVTVEKAAIRDKTSWGAMTASQRREYSAYLAGDDARDPRGEAYLGRGGPPPLPDGPYVWLARRRLEASTASQPWSETSQLVREAQGELGQTAVAGWMRKLQDDLTAAERRLVEVASDYSKRDEIATLERTAAAARATLERLDGLDPVERYLCWLEERPTPEEHQGERRVRGAGYLGLDPDAQPADDDGHREHEL